MITALALNILLLVPSHASAAKATPASAVASKSAPSSAPSAAKPGRPDFTGSWKLDMTKSEFGKLPKPLNRTDVISHREPMITQVLYLTNAGSRDTAMYTYRTTGEITHSTVDKKDIQSTGHWDGNDLVLDSKMKFVIFDVAMKERWSLAPGGKTLVYTRTIDSPIMKGDQKLVFAKQ